MLYLLEEITVEIREKKGYLYLTFDTRSNFLN